MEEEFIASERPAWVSALLLISVGMLSFAVIGTVIGVLAALPFMEGGIFAFQAALKNPTSHPEIKAALFVLQICVTFFGLAAVPSLYWWAVERRNIFQLLKIKRTPWFIFLLTVFIVVSFLPFDSIFIEWNSNVTFPEFLGGFDKWARDTEKINEGLLTFFTTFDSFGQFALAFFTISILAGFCEELFFRGMLQPVLKTMTGNIHVAIWTTAILFSAFHLEFFGFVPRMFLGVLFGYLYYWSGNLVLAMLGHMVNNGLMVIVLYLNQKQKLEYDGNETLPLPAVLAALIVFSLLMYSFKRFYKPTTSPA